MDARQQQYCNEVLRFRKALNLTSVGDVEGFHKRFVEPSLALAKWLPKKGRLLDIGSGMGVPGIPLIINNPHLHGVLVERRKKRAEFLRHVVRMMVLDAEVYDADINSLKCLRVDACVARAVTNQQVLLTMCGRHTNVGAVAVLPVPSDSTPAHLDGWKLEDEKTLEAFAGQLVRCYRFG